MFQTFWYRALLVSALISLSACTKTTGEWQTLTTSGDVTPRHEAALVAHKGQLYLLGGRRINPVERFDPKTQHWTQLSKSPIELHHFQAVSYGDAIYIVGAMTGGFPHEKPLSHVLKYYPDEDRFEYGHEIPKARRRGGAGVAIYNDKLYIVGGITHGHMYGSRAWLDEYDPNTGEWRVLPDAPHKRDHVQAAIVDGQLYAFAGRRSSFATQQTFELTTRYGDQFDIEQQRWLATTQNLAIPTERAGNMVIAWDNYIVIGGGESARQSAAHQEVEAFNTTTQQWETLPSLQRGRHGSSFAIIDGYLYTASGCGNAGGSPELASVERIKLSSIKPQTTDTVAKTTAVHMQWHTVTLPFEGPHTAETADLNPFMDYRLHVRFSHANSSYNIPGFFAADGKAADTSADAGTLWQARFSPDRTGLWRYEAELRHGKDIAISDDPNAGDIIPLPQASGEFWVIESDKTGADFRAHGKLIADKGYFKFAGTNNYWLKGGTNSPENFLGYTEFDGTYLAATSAREGEAERTNHMHRFTPHIDDWQLGDPLWQANANGTEGKGKGIIGAVNYLADQGMNAAYFLTFNLTGDGNDVWPYIDHQNLERFDVSKLAQWNRVFEHMQAKGIMLHLVTQETENEKLLDGGNTERLRKLYYRELIARFGHHLALVWNLGEENGPADFSPDGQNDQQRIDMANYLAEHDPYGHPILIHSHASAKDKDHILGPLLGLDSLNGSSFQVDHRERVNQEIATWRKRAEKAGQPWLITMDEIGLWHTGALPDAIDPTHDSLREHALWGAILGGAAGVEWYFGAKHPGNDLSAEDWRMRHNLWAITHHALQFFKDRPFWRYTPCNTLLNSQGYCAGEAKNEYVIYSAKGEQPSLKAGALQGLFDVYWFDPIKGGELVKGSTVQINTTANMTAAIALGQPPYSPEQDWVLLLKAAISTEQARAF